MFFRTVYFLPYVVAAPIAGKIWSVFYNPYFGVNKIFESLGLTRLADISILGDPRTALPAVYVVDNWHWWGIF